MWYNYDTATADQIYGTNLITTKATQSVCPKNWTLPSNDQIQGLYNNRSSYASIFSGTTGGGLYNTSQLYTTYGYYWGSETIGSASDYRKLLQWTGSDSTLGVNSGYRSAGYFIRCVAR